MKISEILGKAKEIIRTRWAKGRFRRNYTREVCSLGAIYEVAVRADQYNCNADNSLYESAHRQLSEVIKGHNKYVERVGSASYSSEQVIAIFNDSYATTQQEVLDVFEEAERRAKLAEDTKCGSVNSSAKRKT